jgi:hypothetical protein
VGLTREYGRLARIMINGHDKGILRGLAEQVAEIAALPVHKTKAAEWRRMNALRPGKPMVSIYQLPWHELSYQDELTRRCEGEYARAVEWELLSLIYQWKHAPGDMIVDPVYQLPRVINDSMYGVTNDIEVIRQGGENGGIYAYEYHGQIKDESDVARIKDPVLVEDKEATEARFQALSDAFGDVLPVRVTGVLSFWFSPWDLLVQWYGVQDALMDIVLRPELVHAAIDRLTDAYLARLRQWRELNLLDHTEGNFTVGSGGLGFAPEIPAEGFDPERVRTIDQWGSATAQIFSTVSPETHEEFALQYERKWLSQFGLAYYGCCEPLHNKLDVLASIPNLRKISMSPWADLDVAIPKMGNKYVVSLKPSPAIFAGDVWNPKQARADLVERLEKCRGCAIEVIMKDVSTVRGEPQRVWEWSQIAKEVTEQFA